MDFIDLLIFIAILIVVCHAINYVLSFYFGVYEPITSNQDGTFMPRFLKNLLIGLKDMLAAMSIPVLIIILKLFTLMYIIYLVIIYIIPPTGFATLFIPIREILLQIYPLPPLINRGVFRLYDRILEIFSLKESVLKLIIKFMGALFEFSRENIKEVLIFLFPSLEKEINNYAQKKEEEFYNNNENKELKLKDLTGNEIYRKIQLDKEMCIAQNTKMITPDMNASEKMQTNIKNNFEKVNCESKSISNYIRSNN